MTDINLLRDSEEGGEKKEKEEKAERKSKVFVELTNPERETIKENTEKPGSGFWSSLKEIFTGKPKSPSGSTDQPRILHEQRLSAEPEQSARTPEKKIKERYVKQVPAEQGLEDVFAPAPQETKRTLPPIASPASPAFPSQVPPSIGDASYQGAVNVAPTPPPPPPSPTKTKRGAAPAVTQAMQQGTGEPPTDETGNLLGVNLIPEEMQSGVNKQNRFLVLMFIAIITALIVGLFYVGLSLYQSKIVKDTESRKQDIANLDVQLQQLTQKKTAAVAFHALTQQTLSLLDHHIYWTKFLSGLEKYTLQTVSIKGFAADQAGHLTLTLSAKDFTSVAQQLLAFRAATDFIKDVSINAATHSSSQGGIDSVDFTATVTLVPGVYYKDSTGGPTYSFGQ